MVSRETAFACYNEQMLLTPPPEAIFYETDTLYACLASYPLTAGHTIVAWKQSVADLNALSCDEYAELMEAVDIVRDALLAVLGVEKVYLMYMDEVKHVHWHLVPRYDEAGLNVFKHTPEETKDFSLTAALRAAVVDTQSEHHHVAV